MGVLHLGPGPFAPMCRGGSFSSGLSTAGPLLHCSHYKGLKGEDGGLQNAHSKVNKEVGVKRTIY